MSSIKLRQSILLLALASLFMAGVSCNAKTEDDDIEIAVTPALVAVKNFYLKANDSVMSKLDSVFFSIDLTTGVIFNADSLPKGTDVSKIVPSITFANTMTKAELSFLKNNVTDTVTDYLANPGDTIDFTYPVTLDVTAQNGVNTFTYQIKVNVHQQDPDTLVWDRLSTSLLPSRFENPAAQKTVFRNPTAYCLIEEYNGDYTLSLCNDLNQGEWIKEELNIDFIPQTESFTATPDYFYILSEEGDLMWSENGFDWESTGESWMTILGSYGYSILGIKESGENLIHTQYPLPQGYVETPVSPEFPITGSSALGVGETRWADTDFAILTGGKTSDGTLSSNVWAFDGETWAVINEGFLPALYKPMMARYIVFRDTPIVFTQRELDVWLLFGGMDMLGQMNRTVYMSYDNGVHWTQAPAMMQLPEVAPSLEGADVIVAGYALSADLADAWTKEENTRASLLTRSSYTIDGTDITWICPYLYVFGGYLENDTLSTTIWRGVLARLTFTPSI